MTKEDFGIMLFVAMMAGCLLVGYLLAHVLEIAWFKERLTAPDRWTRVAGMLPIAAPAYLIANLIYFSRHP